MEDVPLNIEDMIVAVGHYLYSADGSITNVTTVFLKDLRLLVDAELERREATIH
jgi:hypothetical protein